MSTISKRLVRAAGIALAVAGVFMAGSAARGDGGTWTTKAPMPTGNIDAARGVIGGKVYVAGSVGSANLTEVYDPVANTWASAAAPLTPRTAGGYGVINGKLYFAGGAPYGDENNNTNVLEVYDPATNAWTTRAPMLTRRDQVASGVVNGKLYVAGGHVNGSAPAIGTLEEYDPTTNAWATRASMPFPTQALDSAVAVGGKLFVAGGYTMSERFVARLQVYDAASNSWSIKASMPTARGWASCVELNGRVFVLGGVTVVGGSDVATDVVESYDPATDTWRAEPSLPSARHGTAAAVVDGVLYAAGGYSGSATLTTTDAFTPASGAWTMVAPLPGLPRASLAAIGVGNTLFVCGGGTHSGGVFDNVPDLYAFDTGAGTWTQKASAPRKRTSFGMCAVNGVLYAVGNSEGLGGTAVDAYDTTTNTWTTKAPFPIGGGTTVAVVNGIIYAGALGTGDDSMFAYDPAADAWTTRASCPDASEAQGLKLAALGGIVYGAGYDPATNVPTLRAYDPTTNTWSVKTPPALTHVGSSGGFVAMQGRLWLLSDYSGGWSPAVESYDPATDTWRFEPSMNVGRTQFGAGVAGGMLFAVAGYDGTSLISSVEKFTPPPSPAGVHVPAAIVQPCDDGTDGATVNFLLDITGSPPSTAVLTVRDLTGNRAILTQSAVAGQVGVGPITFPLGTSTVEVTVTDGTVVLATATFAVQIQDTVAPTLSGIEAKTIECTGPLTPIFWEILGVGATDACDPHPVVTLSPSALPLGTTRVSATARDASGNTASSDFDVTVRDTTPPVFTLIPRDISRGCEGADGAAVAFEVRAADLCGEAGIACLDESGRTVDPAGTSFAVGAHTVTCTATDSSNNSTSVSFKVTIVDDDDPLLVVPADITVSTDAGMATATVSFAVSATDACDPSVAITTSAPSGEVHSGDSFPLGLTTVTCTARDRSGNEVSGSFRVLVLDREAPVLTAPATATLVTDCPGSALSITPAALGVSARDNADPAPALGCSPTSVGPGTTTVDCTATDAAGNVAHASVSVTVLRGTFQVQFLRPLDGAVDNLIKAGQTIPVKVRVTCSNVLDPNATAAVDSVTQIDGSGTPVANGTVEDSGLSNDNGTAMRLADGFYIYNLSTKGWTSASGARFRVRVRVQESGHVDTYAEVVLKNR